jgi:gliding motility-associated-like protein
LPKKNKSKVGNSLTFALSLTSIFFLIENWNMKNFKLFPFIVIILLQVCIICTVNAQIPSSPNCPSPIGNTFVQINGSNSSTCGASVALTAVGVSNIPATDSYVVSNVPYTHYPYVGANVAQTISIGNLVNLSSIDDVWGTRIPLPFSFCFFGNKYDSLMIGSNGNISFDFGSFTAGSANAFAIATPMPNNIATWNNSINALYCDLHPQPNTGCSITWQVYGTSPCRAFVASWDSLPYFNTNSVCSLSRATAQAVLYENTNIIDLNIKYRQYCSSGTTNLTATQGIQNQSGTAAYTVPGHNASVWTDSTKTWRFTPAGTGAAAFTHVWYNVNTGAQIGTGSSINVAPLDTTRYRVVSTFGCSGISVTDTIQINVSDPVVADFTPIIRLGCDNDTVSFINNSIGATNYQWRFEPGAFSIQSNPTHIYQNQGIYPVVLIASDANCKDTLIIPVNLNHPINALFIDSSDKLCLIDPTAGARFRIFDGSTGNPLVRKYFITNGSTFNDTIIKTFGSLGFYNFYAAGNYTVTLQVTDTLGCTATYSKTVFVSPTPYADFTVSDNTICYGEPTTFIDTIPPFSLGFNWNFGDGFTLNDYHNPQHNYSSTGLKTVTLAAKFLYCPDYSVSKTIDVLNYPSVNLGPDTSYCTGVTANLNIAPANQNNITDYLWSTGDVGSFIIVSTPGTYWLQASNQGCNAADTIIVANDCYVVLPNSFTPASGDGLNNYFMASNDQFKGAKSFSFDVYNRWGEKVFTTTNLNSRGWDGKFGDTDQPMGVYIYQISVVFKNGERKSFNGNVTLLR